MQIMTDMMGQHVTIMMMMIRGVRHSDTCRTWNPNTFMAAEPRLRVMATTAAWSRNQHSEEIEGAESIGDLEEPQSAESALSTTTTGVGTQREQEQQQAGEAPGRAQRTRSQTRCESVPPHRNELDVRTEGRIDNWMKESTLNEHDSSTAEKKARARRAKRRA